MIRYVPFADAYLYPSMSGQAPRTDFEDTIGPLEAAGADAEEVTASTERKRLNSTGKRVDSTKEGAIMNVGTKDYESWLVWEKMGLLLYYSRLP